MSGSFQNETAAVELADGSVMLNVRSESKANRRLVTVSPNGATGWSQPRFDDALVEPDLHGEHFAGVVSRRRSGAGEFCLLTRIISNGPTARQRLAKVAIARTCRSS